MALLLGMITPLGWLERVPTYKERLRDLAERDIVEPRLARLPGAADGRHHDRRRTVRAGGRGPGLPPRDQPRDRAPVQPALRRGAARAAGPALVDPDDPRLGRTQDVEVARQRRRSAATSPTRSGPRCGRSSPIRRRCAAATPAGPEICPIFALQRRFSPRTPPGSRSTAAPAPSAASTARRSWRTI